MASAWQGGQDTASEVGSGVSRTVPASESVIGGTSHQGVLNGTLEPYDGKLSRTVLRGEGGREAPDLPGVNRREMARMSDDVEGTQ